MSSTATLERTGDNYEPNKKPTKMSSEEKKERIDNLLRDRNLFRDQLFRYLMKERKVTISFEDFKDSCFQENFKILEYLEGKSERELIDLRNSVTNIDNQIKQLRYA